VTLCGFWPSHIPTDAVTLRTASGATLGRVTAALTEVPRSRARCVAFRQRELQKRAVERCGLNCTPQAEQAILMPPSRPAPASPSATPREHASADQIGSS